MENDRQKWVNLSFIAIAALLSWVVYMLVMKFSGTWDLEARISNFQWIVRGGTIGLGLIAFIILFRHEKANQFAHEVFVELGRVTWPTVTETNRGTVVVIVFVIICGLILGTLDTFWAWALKQVLSLGSKWF